MPPQKLDGLFTRWSKRLGLDLRYWVTNSFWTSIPVGLEVVTNVILTVIYTRLVTQQVFGEYRFYFAALAFFTILSMPQIPTAVVQAVARGYHGCFRQGFRAMLRFSFLVTAAFLLGAAYFFFTDQVRLWPYFLLTGLLFPLFHPFRIYIGYLHARERFREASLALTVETLASFAASLAVMLVSPEAGHVWMAYLLSRILVRITFFLLIRRRYPETWSGTADAGAVKYGVHLTMSDFLPGLLTSSERVIITFLAGLDGLAIFSVARTIAKPAEPVMRPITRLFLPRLSKKRNAADSYSGLVRKLPALVGATVLLNLVGFLLVPWLFSILYPPSYAAGIPVARVLFIGQFVVVANTLLRNFLTAHKRTVELYSINLFPQALAIVGMFVLFPLAGLVGIAFAVVARNYLLFSGFLAGSWLFSRRARQSQR